jgi:hypothetical protein
MVTGFPLLQGGEIEDPEINRLLWANVRVLQRFKENRKPPIETKEDFSLETIMTL